MKLTDMGLRSDVFDVCVCVLECVLIYVHLSSGMGPLVSLRPRRESLLPHGGSRTHKGVDNYFTDGRSSVDP